MTAGPPTTKQYLTDPYKHSFQAQLLRCESTDDGRFVAVLDESFFYPESGGQAADRGTIEGVAVLDVWEDEAEVVYHQVESELVTGPVKCSVDWPRRFDHMQQHTGQHVLSRALIEVDGHNTISFHMGDEACTIDLDGDASQRALDSAERLANTVIHENRAVHIHNMSPDELEDVTLRKKLPEGVTEVRLVEIADFDTIGCCGTHVRRTGELGVLKVLKQERVKGTSRITFKVGGRALRDYASKHNILKDLAVRFTTSVEGLADKIEKMSVEARANRKQVQKISKQLAMFEARDLIESASEHGGVKCVVRLLGDYEETYLRLLSSELKHVRGTINLLGNDDGVVVCNASMDLSVDFSESVIEYAKAEGGSGGGKGGFATVRLPAGAPVETFLAQVLERIKARL